MVELERRTSWSLVLAIFASVTLYLWVLDATDLASQAAHTSKEERSVLDSAAFLREGDRQFESIQRRLYQASSASAAAGSSFILVSLFCVPRLSYFWWTKLTPYLLVFRKSRLIWTLSFHFSLLFNLICFYHMLSSHILKLTVL